MKLEVCIATAVPGLADPCLHNASRLAVTHPLVTVLVNGPVAPPADPKRDDGFGLTDYRVITLDRNVGVAPAYDRLYRESRGDVLLFMHDDVELMEFGWDAKILGLFGRKEIALAGPAGGHGFGTPGMYGRSFSVGLFNRHDFVSSLDNWRIHGRQGIHPERIAVLDGLAIAVRRDFLVETDGWSFWPVVHHGYDGAIACEAARRGHETWFVPVICHHLGSRTASAAIYTEGLAAEAGGDGAVHAAAHLRLYEQYRDVLPLHRY